MSLKGSGIERIAQELYVARIFLVFVLGIGFTIGLTIRPGDRYQALAKPRFTPPNGLSGSLGNRLYPDRHIGDNRLGGWISYRAAKAAQNQIVKTAALEIARTHPAAIVVTLHAGRVATRLSQPFSSGH